MGKFRKKPVVIEAISFVELVKYGLENGTSAVNGIPWSFNYNGHQITHENDECYLIPTLEGTMKMTPNDMLITGVQGEIYPCKKDIFEATYEDVADDFSDKDFNNLLSVGKGTFGMAIEAVKHGKKIARKGWNGKGMFVFMRPEDELSVDMIVNKVKSLPDSVKKFFTAKCAWNEKESKTEVSPENIKVKFTAYLCMYAADGSIVNGWLASQTDILAEDWQIVE